MDSIGEKLERDLESGDVTGPALDIFLVFGDTNPLSATAAAAQLSEDDIQMKNKAAVKKCTEALENREKAIAAQKGGGGKAAVLNPSFDAGSAGDIDVEAEGGSQAAPSGSSELLAFSYV